VLQVKMPLGKTAAALLPVSTWMPSRCWSVRASETLELNARWNALPDFKFKVSRLEVGDLRKACQACSNKDGKSAIPSMGAAF
jgi:hypothetical protein